jgi:hypothetical protein
MFYNVLCFVFDRFPVASQISGDENNLNNTRTGGTIIHKWNGRNLEYFQSLNKVPSVPAISGAWNRFFLQCDLVDGGHHT